MSDHAAELFRLVVTNPDLRLYKREDPGNPAWCQESRLLIEWGEKLCKWVGQSPTDGGIAYAQLLLEKQYWRLYHRVTDEHRRDERHATHPCLHRAYLKLWESLEDLQFLTFPPELTPPVGTTPAEPDAAIELVAPNPDPPVEEVSGIELGEFIEEDEEADGGGEDDYQRAE